MKGKIESVFIKDRNCYVYTPYCYENENDRAYPVIYCNDGDIMMESFDKIADEIEECFETNDECKCIIVMIPPIDRNKEYTPWKSRNPFNKEIFYGYADEYIDYLINIVKPNIDSLYRTKTEREHCSILGYSLGGLAALYTMFKCSTFSRSVCISSSLWYENWHDFIKGNEISDNKSDIFFYLGKNENKSRNVVLKTVLQSTEETYEILKNQLTGVVTFDLVEGGHFNNVEHRYAVGIIRICDNNRHFHNENN